MGQTKTYVKNACQMMNIHVQVAFAVTLRVNVPAFKVIRDFHVVLLTGLSVPDLMQRIQRDVVLQLLNVDK